MNRCAHHRRNSVAQSLIPAHRLGLTVLWAITLALFLNAPARAGSVSSTLQVRVRVVGSCRVTADSLQSPIKTTQGRFNCPGSSASSASTSAAAYGQSAIYTVSDSPGTGGAVKILTLNF